MKKGSIKSIFIISLLLTCIQQYAADLTNFFDSNIASIFDRMFLETNAKEYTETVNIIKHEAPQKLASKDWTIILYIAADNDLGPFGIRNIKQMAKIGSNEYVNIVVQLDIRKSNGEKVTRRYYIKKGTVLHVNADDPTSQRLDSGDAESLISCCSWATTNFPAKQYGLVLWNHGSGVLDPIISRIIKAEELFYFNYETEKLELDRSVGYIDRMADRGICWDDTTGNYLSNAKLNYALDKICSTCLNGNKFSFIGFDACLMQMVGIANIMKHYAHIMIGSQEAELGYGWNYADALEPFTKGSINPVDLADHIVGSYQKSYERITCDYTLSAINLDAERYLEANIDEIATLLITGLYNQANGSVKKAIKASRNKIVCTQFDEPSYIDLHNFYTNLLSNMWYMKLTSSSDEKTWKTKLKEALEAGLRMIGYTVFANTAGEGLSKAKGISIYFPETGIYPSYKTIPFAQENNWILFLAQYLVA